LHLWGKESSGNLFGMPKDKNPGKRILVVEDDPSARGSIRILLNIDRHTVTEARHGSEALALAGAQPFDLVILDYAMPGMQGGEVARQLRKIAPTVPILMVTAYSEKLRDADLPGVSEIIGKPYSVEELRNAVSKLAG
jgi:CheY-like chemotaxis protein